MTRRLKDRLLAPYFFISTKYRKNSKLILTATFLALVVILLGAYTRLTDAGLSCPDWPHCYGFLTAPHTPEQILNASQKFPETPVVTKKAWTEMTHRYFAGTEGILVIIIAFSILMGRKQKSFKAIFIAVALLALIIVQVALGALTVTEKLKPVIVSSHLIAGLSLLGFLWWTYLDLQLQDDFFLAKKKLSIQPLIAVGLFFLVFQIMLGGWVSSHYAGLACIDLPYCNGVLLPKLGSFNQDLITIHMLHRIGAVITGTYLLILAIVLSFQSIFRRLGLCLLGLTSLQFSLGVLNVLWLRPVWIALLHHGIAIALLLTLITILVKAAFVSDNRYGSLFA